MGQEAVGCWCSSAARALTSRHRWAALHQGTPASCGADRLLLRSGGGRRGRRAAAPPAFDTNWATAHSAAIELTARLAELAPGALEKVFFTSGAMS